MAWHGGSFAGGWVEVDRMPRTLPDEKATLLYNMEPFRSIRSDLDCNRLALGVPGTFAYAQFAVDFDHKLEGLFQVPASFSERSALRVHTRNFLDGRNILLLAFVDDCGELSFHVSSLRQSLAHSV
jgi:hypothetical protein